MQAFRSFHRLRPRTEKRVATRGKESARGRIPFRSGRKQSRCKCNGNRFIHSVLRVMASMRCHVWPEVRAFWLWTGQPSRQRMEVCENSLLKTVHASLSLSSAGRSGPTVNIQMKGASYAGQAFFWTCWMQIRAWFFDELAEKCNFADHL